MALILARHLPLDSAFMRKQTGGIAWGWDQEATVALIDLLQVQIRVALAAAGVKPHKIPKVVEIERPFDLPTPKRKVMPVKEMVEYVGGILGGTRG